MASMQSCHLSQAQVCQSGCVPSFSPYPWPRAGWCRYADVWSGASVGGSIGWGLPVGPKQGPLCSLGVVWLQGGGSGSGRHVVWGPSVCLRCGWATMAMQVAWLTDLGYDEGVGAPGYTILGLVTVIFVSHWKKHVRSRCLQGDGLGEP